MQLPQFFALILLSQKKKTVILMKEIFHKLRGKL